MDKIPVVEVFKSFQGEGLLTGRRALFVRLAGCNLVGKCKYCDTDFRVRMLLTPEELAKMLDDYVDDRVFDNWVVFTGGEPMLYQDKIVDVIELTYMPEFLEFQVETNGTIKPRDAIIGWVKYFVVSPKRLWFDKAVENFTDSLYLRRLTHYKFVVGEIPPDDIAFWTLDAVRQAIDELLDRGVRKDNIWLMPFGATKEELERNSQLVWKLADELNVNYSDRVHVRVWWKSMMGV